MIGFRPALIKALLFSILIIPNSMANEPVDPLNVDAAETTTEVNPTEAFTQQVEEELAPAISNQGIDAYNRGVELFQIAQTQAERGNITGQKDLLRESIHNFEKAVELSPDLVEAQSNVGFAWLTLKKYKKAIKAFEKALTINDKHLNTLNGLSTAYAFKGDTDSALETFERLTTLDPGNPQYFFNKASILQKDKRDIDAIEAYKKALHLQPNHQRSLFNLGTLNENQGKLSMAKQYYEQAKDVDISNPIGLESVHRLEFIELKLKEQAVAEEEKALSKTDKSDTSEADESSNQNIADLQDLVR